MKKMEAADKEKDSVIVYTINNPGWLGKQIWGKEKGTTDNVISYHSAFINKIHYWRLTPTR